MSQAKSSGLRGERSALTPNVSLHFIPSLVRPGSLAGPAARALIDLHGFHDHHAVVVAPAHLVALIRDLGGLQLPVNKSKLLSQKAGPSAAKSLSNQGGRRRPGSASPGPLVYSSRRLRLGLAAVVPLPPTSPSSRGGQDRRGALAGKGSG